MAATSPIVVYAPEMKVIMMIELEKQGTPNQGCIYQDHSSKGIVNGKRVYCKRWVAEIYIDNQRYRRRSYNKSDVVEWIKAVRMGKIKPTDNKADWIRMEQRKDLPTRYDEVIVSAVEESHLVYEYHQTGDLQPICEYMTNRLLPHMIYYCCHTLNLGRSTSINYALQAGALILRDIDAGKPVTNMTRQCKRMLRVRKAHKSFWYYEKDAPEHIKNIVNGLDLTPLAEVWNLTKDRRL